MNIALVGIGKIALDQHVPAIRQSKDWDLAATVSRSGRVPGVAAFDSLEAMLAARADIRVVSLCLPPVPRFDYAVRALREGRHVMLEKPPGASLAECHALADLARKSRVSLFATWHSREAAMVDAARDWLAGQTLRRMRIIWKEDVRRWHPGQDWIWEPGGMGVFDPGINALSIATKILPRQMMVEDAVLQVPSNKQCPIAARMRFRYPGAEVSAVFDWRQTGPQTWTIEAETETGLMRLTDGGARLEIGGIQQLGGIGADGEYPRLYKQMYRLIAAGACDVDVEPLRLVADAFMLGRREVVAPFFEQEAG